MKLTFRLKGGAGSGNFGHAGRPGKVGGSASGSGGAVDEYAAGERMSDTYYNLHDISTERQNRHELRRTLKVTGSTDGGKHKRYFTNMPKDIIRQQLESEGYAKLSDYEFEHPVGVSFRISNKVGKYGGYYMYADIKDN